MKLWLHFGLILGLAASPAFASELAVLHNGFSIRHEKSEIVGSVTRLYLGTDRSGYVDIPTNEIDRFEKDLTPPVLTPPALARPTEVPVAERPQSLNEVIDTIGNRHHIDPDLINSVIRAESGFKPHAVSPKGAQGLMQLMPHTASQLGVANAFDPKSNVEGGTRYLRELLERYNFDLVKALAAYNAGPHRVEQYRGVPPYYETRAYVASIIRDFNRKKRAQQKISAASKSKPVTSQPQLASTKKRQETSASRIEPLPGSH
jgi:hypothetical protein